MRQMQLGIVVRSFDPIDIAHRHEMHGAVASNNEPTSLPGQRATFFENPALGTLERPTESLCVERLEKIVEDPHVEGTQRVGVVCRYKYDGRWQRCSQHLQYVKSIALRHLHVEKYQVRFTAPNLLDSSMTPGALNDARNLRVTAEQRQNIASGQWFVINDEHVNWTCHLTLQNQYRLVRSEVRRTPLRLRHLCDAFPTSGYLYTRALGAHAGLSAQFQDPALSGRGAALNCAR